MKESIAESLRVYLTSVAASVSSLYIFNEIVKSRTSSSPQPTIIPQSTRIWSPLSPQEIQNIKVMNDYYGIRKSNKD